MLARLTEMFAPPIEMFAPASLSLASPGPRKGLEQMPKVLLLVLNAKSDDSLNINIRDRRKLRLNVQSTFTVRDFCLGGGDAGNRTRVLR